MLLPALECKHFRAFVLTMMKILTLMGQADLCIAALGVLICRASKTARTVKTELKRWKRSSTRPSSPKKVS